MTAALDLDGLLDALGRHGVRFVVVGSVAAAAHGAPDVTPGDLDIVPADDPTNLRRLADALDDLEAEPEPVTGSWAADADGGHRWVEDGVQRPAPRRDPAEPASFDASYLTRFGRLDVVPRIAGVPIDLLRRSRSAAVAGRLVRVAHASDVLAGITAPRRIKDAPRVAALRAAAARPSGVGFVGFRTTRFDAMVAMFRDRIGLEVVHEAPGAIWFRLGEDAELHVYADTDPDHAFFTTGPVVGLRVDDVSATRAALETDGLELLTDIEHSEAAAWCHVRAPDGTVLEIIGPAGTDA